MTIAFSRRSLRTICVLVLSLVSTVRAHSEEPHRTRNVIIVMTDGLRWQEVFDGADPVLLSKGAVMKGDSVLPDRKERNRCAREEFLRPTKRERREALMPFLWNSFGRSGQLFGNRGLSSSVVATNGLNISFPGYSETLTGLADPRVHSNEKVPNPNVTVLEWLDHRPDFQGRVAAFGAWDAFSAIFNSERCRFPVNSGYEPFTLLPNNTAVDALNRLKTQAPRIWAEEPFDAVPFYTALEYLKTAKPRVLFIGLGETDDWAHAGDYPEYLGAAHRLDQYLRELWKTIQNLPEYRQQTTLIVTVDHGRGRGRNWTSHGAKLPESRELWLGVMGPDTAPLGERRNTEEIQQTYFAATVAALLGENFHSAAVKAESVIREILPSATRERLLRLASNEVSNRRSQY
jgi:Type I phosphodiesterase / nucleotide pyrophosphatase